MDNDSSAGSPLFLQEDAQSRVLRFLWRSRAEWSGREIARKVGLSAPACHESLKKLDARGLVQLRRISNAHLYKINPENYFVRNVFARIFEAEEDLPNQIAAVVRKTLAGSAASGIVSVAIFGSAARGTARPGSDLDVLVVLDSGASLEAVEPRIELLRNLLFRRFSFPLSTYIQTVSELRKKHRSKLPLIREILKDGRTIYGKEIKELLA